MNHLSHCNNKGRQLIGRSTDCPLPDGFAKKDCSLMQIKATKPTRCSFIQIKAIETQPM
jgi:hypothetical protein